MLFCCCWFFLSRLRLCYLIDLVSFMLGMSSRIVSGLSGPYIDRYCCFKIPIVAILLTFNHFSRVYKDIYRTNYLGLFFVPSSFFRHVIVRL